MYIVIGAVESIGSIRYHLTIWKILEISWALSRCSSSHQRWVSLWCRRSNLAIQL